MTPTAIVLGAAVWAGGVPSPTLTRRIETAARAYRAKQVDRIVVSGGVGRHPPSEAEVMARALRDIGIPDAAIIEEPTATNTLDNLRLSHRLIPEGTPVVLITDAYHQPRARLVARRLGMKATSLSPPLKGANLRQVVTGSLREFLAFWWYLFRD